MTDYPEFSDLDSMLTQYDHDAELYSVGPWWELNGAYCYSRTM